MNRTESVYLPVTDIYEGEQAYHLYLEMPGVLPEKVDLRFDKGLLTVKGQVERASREGLQCMLHEFEVGDYQRTFTVSDEIDDDGITAQMNEGVLHIVMPKSTMTKVKRIEVK